MATSIEESISQREKLENQYDRTVREEIETFRTKAISFLAGDITENDFRPFRLKHGIYGQRQPGVQMVRCKIPGGLLTAPQVNQLARIADEFGGGRGHLTTRQNIQYHFVPLPCVADLMHLLADVGLTNREACYNTVRKVELFEMRPARTTPAHQTTDFAELVCSNSLKSDSENTAPWLLKEEMRRAGSLLLEIARECAVPAGHALAVDRVTFATRVTEAISRKPRIEVKREEVTAIDESREVTIIATGPLTSDGLASEIARLSEGAEESGSQRAGAPTPQRSHLYFYDSISPIVEADSIDMSRVYMAARYDKGSADYINCPMTPEEYSRFYDARHIDRVRLYNRADRI